MGYWFQAIWATMGIFLAYYYICMMRRKVDYWPLFIFIFFSGMDYVGTWLLGRNAVDLFQPEHLEWWAQEWQFSSMTTLLFWTYNQAIPAWLATALVLVQKNKKNLFYILSLLILSSTFAFVGLIPIVLYFALRRQEGGKMWREIFSLQNMVGVLLIGILSVAYLMSNGQVEKSRIGAIKSESQQIEVQQVDNQEVQVATDNVSETVNNDDDFSAKLLCYILFAFVEYLPYVFLICKSSKGETLLWVCVGILLTCPLISLGDAQDFCMRASIPALFCLMIYCIDFFDREVAISNYRLLIPMAVILLIGSITPFNEIHRSVSNTINYAEDGLEYTLIPLSGEGIFGSGYHFGYVDGNLFMKYLAK